MNGEQITLFLIFGAIFVLLIHGRVRYDLVAFCGLIVGTLVGLVPVDSAFEGFGHPAVVIIALVLIVSRGLSNSGAIEMIAARVLDSERAVPTHIGVMSVVGAALSGVINNVAALALLMPLDIEAAEKAKRAIARTLMPLSFATILGGMITMIGTPPNIVIAQYREDVLGEPFRMFDFLPVGLAVACSGILFVALIGWRLLPGRSGAEVMIEETEKSLYAAELRVGAAGAGDEVLTLGDFYPVADELDINLIGLIRNQRRLPGFSRREPINEGDYVVVEGDPKQIEIFMGKTRLEFDGAETREGEERDNGVRGGGLALLESIVPDGAPIIGRSAMQMGLLAREGVTLMGVARQGRRFRERVRRLPIAAGDVLLLLGTPERLDSANRSIGTYPLEGRRTSMVQRSKAPIAAGLFLLAIVLAVGGWVYLPIALAACAAAYAAIGLVDGKEVYEAVEWKVIVLLASLIPLGQAFEATGSAQLVAASVVSATEGMPAWTVLAALMVVTMTLSDFLNNVATALIAGPIGLEIARTLSLDPDPFLMGVAVAASCAFLTPIGHKNNTIIMGPGGYHFGDYWRMGLPLEILVLCVSLPMILLVWPM